MATALQFAVTKATLCARRLNKKRGVVQTKEIGEAQETKNDRRAQEARECPPKPVLSLMVVRDFALPQRYSVFSLE
jgi:hypothetical protein